MARRQNISWGSERFRVGPWHVDAGVAQLTVRSHYTTPSAAGVTDVLHRLSAKGFRRVMTAALSTADVQAFLATGFTERERLVVLQRPVTPHDGSPTPRVSRLRRRNLDTVLRIDHAAFPAIWQLDVHGLRDALAATRRSRLRVAHPAEHQGPAAYAVSGHANGVGYLQRLAVHPDAQRDGLASELCHDMFAWMSRSRVHQVMVNTQMSNTAAREFYRRLGFTPAPSELVVLECDL